MKDLIITGYCSCFYSVDPAGRRLEINDRHAACFILPVKGQLCFTTNDQKLYADAEHPLFLPRGLRYKNECIQSAESYVFNFYTLHPYEAMVSLSPVSPALISENFAALRQAEAHQDHLNALRLLYTLAHPLCTPATPTGQGQRLLGQACTFIAEHLQDPALSVTAIAEHCFISEIYLRKLFTRRLNCPPMRYVTRLRMEKARLLVAEKRPVGEIARAVGYGDIYQFSRAYKQHFGVSPLKHQ